MVIEYIRYTIPPEQAEQFAAAYAEAGRVLDADEHCVRYEVGRGVEEPEHWVVRIEWDSLDGHERGFRSSAAFPTFLAAVGPYFDNITEMKHYQVEPTAQS